jgi:hypothetical protein
VTLTVAIGLLVFGLTVDILIGRALLRRFRSWYRAGRPVKGLQRRIGDYS